MQPTALQVSPDLALELVLQRQSLFKLKLTRQLFITNNALRVFHKGLIRYEICSYEVIAIVGQSEAILYDEEGVGTLTIA